MDKNKINILYIIATLDIGGAERQLVELVKRVDKKKFNPVICCLTRGGLLEQELKEANVEYFILGKKFKFDFSVISKLIPVLKQKNIHILHTWMFTSNSFGRIAGVFSKVPVIVASERGVDRWKNKFELCIDRVLSHFTDKIICVSEGVKSFYHKYAGISLDKLVTIYGGVNINDKTNVNKNIREELGFEGSISVITTIGHLVSCKGIEYLLYAVPRVVKDFPDVQFLIIGDGSQRNKLNKLALSLGINKYVVFLGVRKDIREILKGTDIFVLPSLIEGLPNAIMEAMLAEKPVIATNIPGTDELVIDDETGILVTPKDGDSLASAIITLLKNPLEGKKMGVKGKQRIVKYFSIDETVRKTEELYESLVKLKIPQK